MSSKRQHSKSTSSTPEKPPQKVKRVVGSRKDASKSRKVLFLEPSAQNESDNVSTKMSNRSTWSESELAAMVQYIALYHNTQAAGWPTHKNTLFWEKCAEAVAETSGLPKRAGNACRHKIFNFFRKNFETVDEAEKHFNIKYFDDDFPLVVCSMSTPKSGPVPACSTSVNLSPIFEHSPTTEKVVVSETNGHAIKSIISLFGQLSFMQQEQLLSRLLHQYMGTLSGKLSSVFLPHDTIGIIASAMKNLRDNDKPNLIYYLGKCLEPGKEGQTRLPMDRMPYGLLSHNIMFFGSEDVTNLHPESHFVEWEISMFSHFGHKWTALQRGPMWSECDVKELPTVDVNHVINENEEIDPIQNVCEEISTQVASVQNGYKNNIIQQALAETFGDSSGEDLQSCIVADVDLPVTSEKELSANVLHNSDGNETLCPPVSSLWSGLTNETIEDMGQSSLSIGDLTRLHRLDKTSACKSRQVKRDPTKARVNVAGLSVRQLQRRIKNTGFTKDTSIQVKALLAAQQKAPNGRWWIKADAFDVRIGLRESLKNEWSGDTDLGDGKLQELKKNYDQRISAAKIFALGKHGHELLRDLKKMQSILKEDLVLLNAVYEDSKKAYEKKLGASNVKENTLFALAWDVVEYETLTKQNLSFQSDILPIVSRLQNKEQLEGNTAKFFTEMRKGLLPYCKGVFGKQREAASHVFAFMIAEEQRNVKPYASPVRFLTYSSTTDKTVRDLKQQLVDEMRKLNMLSVGFVTDGEFSSLRTMGAERPLSIIELIAIARKQAKSDRVQDIKKYLTPVVKEGIVLPELGHEAIPLEDVQWLHEFMENGCGDGTKVAFEKAVFILRRKQYPFHYDPRPWIAGKSETLGDVLKSLMATYHYKKLISSYVSAGVDFRNHIYYPECDHNSGQSGEYFHEREDHNHLLKRITNCLRSGEIPNVRLQYFRDALNNPSTGLTKSALTGVNKQSVPDCERMFSVGMIDFMQKNGHTDEMAFLRLVHNWHKASDGRGLDEDTRHLYNKQMLNWILDDWMPWHRDNYDFSTIDVNRRIKGVQGLTREIIIGLSTNIESQELRRCEHQLRGLAPEHPRASSTDDVEGLVGMLHDMFGPVFDHKTLLDQMPKVFNECGKRMDPELPYYYWTSYKERYHSDPLPHFNKPSTDGKERLDTVKISRRADPGVFVANRAQLPQKKNSLTVRATFHRAPECLPELAIDL